MSLVDVTKMWSKDGGSYKSDKANAFDYTVSFSEGYQILTDADHDPAYVVQNAVALGLPALGYQHSSNENAFVKRLNPQRIGPVFWMVEVGYEGISNDSAIVDVEWSDVSSTEPIDRDWNGDAIVTANIEQVDGLTVDISDQVCTIRRKFNTINTAAISVYRRSTNSDTFLGWPPGTCRLVGFSAKNQFKYGQPQELWDVTARFQFREPFNGTTPEQAWYKRWRHEGLMIKDFGGNIVRARDKFLQEVTKPVLLKANGEQEFEAANAVFIHTQVYGSLPYSALGLV